MLFILYRDIIRKVGHHLIGTTDIHGFVQINKRLYIPHQGNKKWIDFKIE